MELLEQGGERLLRVDVDSGGRLVEHEQPGSDGERLGDEGPLLLPAGQRRKRCVGLVRRARRARSPRRHRAIVGAPPAPQDAGAWETPRRDQLADGNRSVDRGLGPLGQVADPRAAVEVRRRARRRAGRTAGSAARGRGRGGAASSCRRRSGRRSRRTRPLRRRGRRPRGRERRRRRSRLRRARPLAASERRPQMREVRPHDAEVVLPGLRLVGRQAFDRVQDSGLRARSRARPSGRASARRASRRRPSSRACGGRARRRAGARVRRLGLGREPLDRDLLEAVALGQVGEGLMARDDLVPGAVRQAAPVLAVEPVQPRDQPFRRAAVRAERRPDAVDDQRVAERVEPDVRVAVSSRRPGVSSRASPTRRCPRPSRAAAGSRGRAAGRGLRREALRVARETSRSCGSARGGQVLHADTGAANLLGREREWIERRDDVLLAARVARFAAARSEHGQTNDNDYRSHLVVSYACVVVRATTPRRARHPYDTPAGSGARGAPCRAERRNGSGHPRIAP